MWKWNCKVTCTEEATKMAAKYLEKTKCVSNIYNIYNVYIYICIYMYMYVYIYIYIYIHIHVFRPSQDSSVWLGLTSRRQLMSPECSKHEVLGFAKMLVVWWTDTKYSVLYSVLQSAQWINYEYILMII